MQADRLLQIRFGRLQELQYPQMQYGAFDQSFEPRRVFFFPVQPLRAVQSDFWLGHWSEMNMWNLLFSLRF